jgi:hypothetical protein
MTWESKIVGYGDEAPDQLLANPNNWRVHGKFQQDALQGALNEVGWVAPVIVNRTTGHLVDGHLRVAQAISNDEPTVPVCYVELSEEEEAKTLATFDPIGALASTDQQMLSALVDTVLIDNDALNRVVGEILSDTPPLPDVEPAAGGADLNDQNSLQWGYTTFGKTKVGCSTGEVDLLQAAYDEYVRDHGIDTGFVRWLADGRQ